MGKEAFKKILTEEVARIDTVHTSKRSERVMEGFTKEHCAIIGGKEYTLFNSNDYLGLRFHELVWKGEHEASEHYGAGPGAVRFISGTARVYKDLERALARFHQRDDAMVFSSAFATNVGVIHALLKGQSKDSLVSGETLVVSDALNHRSIIDGIRVAGLDKTHRAIFEHLNLEDLTHVLKENAGKFARVVVVTDGIFSMLGEYQDLQKLQEVCGAHDEMYAEGIHTIVDDAHGVGCFGKTGRGTEEVTGGTADALVGTLGKAFGADGGYVVADQTYIDYLRESAATYIYSNPFSPGTAGAGLVALGVVDSSEGKKLLEQLHTNIAYFKEKIQAAGFTLAVDSVHAIQPVLIGDAGKTRKLVAALFEEGFLVTGISYPVVPQGSDEIRVQLSAEHTREGIERFVEVSVLHGQKLGII